MIRQDAEKYFKNLEEQWYLPESAVQLPKAIFETAEFHGCAEKIDKKFLACVSLLIASHETGDICLRLSARSLHETVQKAIEIGMERKFNALPEISQTEIEILEKLSDGDREKNISRYGEKIWKKAYFAYQKAFAFWTATCGYDQEKLEKSGCDEKIELSVPIDSPFLSVVSSKHTYDDIKNLAMTMPFFLYRDSEDFLYSSKEFWSETQAVNTIARMCAPNAGLIWELADAAAQTYSDPDLLENLINCIFAKPGNPSASSATIKYIDSLKAKAKTAGQTLSAYCASITQAQNSMVDAYREHIEYRNGVRFLDKDFNDQNKDDCHPIDWQKHAVAATCLSNFTVITGGPGTGKTTTVASLLLLLAALSYCSKRTLSIALAAPTGKAANRMRESLIDSKNSEFWKIRFDSVCQYLRNITKGNEEEISSWLNKAIPTISSTIHRLLGSMGGMRFTFGENLRLPHDVIIIDECSMIDSVMLSHLLISIKDGAKIICLGDSDQLPSVGAGSILTNLCNAMLQPTDAGDDWMRDPLKGASVETFKRLDGEEWCEMFPEAISVPVAKLYKSHRFSQKSDIGRVALDVNDARTKTIDENPPCDDSSASFVNIKEKNKGAGNSKTKRSLTDAVVEYAQSGIRTYMETIVKEIGESCVDYALSDNSDKAKNLFDSLNAMRILCTHRKGDLGVEKVCREIDNAVKKFLQNKSSYINLFAESNEIDGTSSAQKNAQKNAFIPDGKENYWYFGKPVMVTKNNPNIGLYNGDVGIVLPDPDDYKSKEQGSRGKYLGVNFKVLFQLGDGSFKYFPLSSLGDIDIAFAMTVHKSQGSQFKHAVIVTPDRDSSLLTRELIYTGITRAQDKVSVLYTDKSILESAIERKTDRCGNLGDRLINEINKNKG